MSNLGNLSREEMHRLIWSMPATKLAEQYGVSSVAVAKRCRKLEVPRPPRGYWAKVAAGKKVRPGKLPPTNVETLERAVGKMDRRRLKFPSEDQPLHPLAEKLARAIAEKPADRNRLVSVTDKALPKLEMCKELGPKAARAFHVILEEVETHGIHFRKSNGNSGGHFRKGRDRLQFRIEEIIVEKEAMKGSPSREVANDYYRGKRTLTGRLALLLTEDRMFFHGAECWKEEAETSINRVINKVTKRVCEFFVEKQRERERKAREDAERHEKWLKEQEEREKAEAIEKEKERLKRHEDKMKAIPEIRRGDLLKAAEWWRIHEATVSFVLEAEQRWRNAQKGELTIEQSGWLQWAREEAAKLSPFTGGYPDPKCDGAFEAEGIPVGGPYPATRNFPRPPTMPETPAPRKTSEEREDDTFMKGSSRERPYPFWLRHR